MLKSNIPYYEERIKDTVAEIMNNLAFTTGRRIYLEWHNDANGHNVYFNGEVGQNNVVLPYHAPTHRECFVGLQTYNKALEHVYKLRTWDNKLAIKENDDENSNSR